MRKKIFTSIAFWCLLFLPAFLAVRNIFLVSPLFGGDAPYFYPEAFGDLLKPSIFTERGVAFGGVNQLYWLSPLMFVYGALGKLLGGDNDTILRVLFLFPSVILSAVGPYFLAKYLKFSKTVRFFASFTYLLNTYYLLLIDGGQVGVALAYGLFPFAVLLLKKLTDQFSKKSILAASGISLLLCLVDPRIFLIAFVVVFIWGLFEKKLPLSLLAVLPVVFIFNLYWLVPIFRSGNLEIASGVSETGVLTILNPLLLFSPHWPSNIFGTPGKPPIYFLLIPFLIFGSIAFGKKNLRLTVLFLVFSALSVAPIGGIFRDSTKFFMPVILFAGILIGLTVEQFRPKANQSWGAKLIAPMVYFYILFLIYPPLLGKMNFLLSNRRAEPSYEAIHQQLVNDTGEFRTVWFPVKHPLTFETLEKPAIDGRDLAKYRPFAALNASEDVFNFLNSPIFPNWLRVLNIKYIFLSPDARNINPTETDQKNWETIKKLISLGRGLEKKNWGTNIDVYEVKNTLPRTFEVNKLVAVIGPDLTTAFPSVYFEDGKWDPAVLLGKNPESLDILFNGKEKLDLTMSFLQKYFISPLEASKSEWAVYPASRYLKYKYELLIRGIEFRDFDYGRGIAFSSQKGERISFTFKIPEKGKYILAVRSADTKKQNLSWHIKELDLEKGEFEYQIVNEDKLSIFNVVALTPVGDFENAKKLSDDMIKNFGEATGKELEDLVIVNDGYWTITTNNYNPNGGGLPIFSMVNGYYIKQ